MQNPNQPENDVLFRSNKRRRGGLQYRDEHRDFGPDAYLGGYGNRLGDRFHLYLRRGDFSPYPSPFLVAGTPEQAAGTSVGNRRSKRNFPAARILSTVNRE